MTTQNLWTLTPSNNSNMQGLAVAGTMLYAAKPVDPRTINSINISSGEITVPTDGNALYNISALTAFIATDGTYLYYANKVSNVNKVYRYNILTFTTDSGIQLPSAANIVVYGLALSNGTLYVNTFNSTTFKNTITPITTSSWTVGSAFIIGPEAPTTAIYGIAADATYLYATDSTNAITKYLIASPHTPTQVYSSSLYTYNNVVIDSTGAYLYALTGFNTSAGVYISKIALNGGTTVQTWKTLAVTNVPMSVQYYGDGLAIDATYLYVNAIDSESQTNAFGKFDLPATTTPTITACSPPVGLVTGGATVTLTGTNLSSVTAVAFGSNAATTFTVVSSTKITATTPAGAAGSVFISVNGTASTVSFTYYAVDPTTIAGVLVANVTFPTTYTSPLVLSAANLGLYFSTLYTLGLTPAQFLTFREAFVTSLFSAAKTNYSLASPIPTIIIDGKTFPYTAIECPSYIPYPTLTNPVGSPPTQPVPANNNYVDTTKPKTLINYTAQNYIVQDLQGENASDASTFLNQFISSSYVTMPNANGNIFTYVFNNVTITEDEIFTCLIPIISGILNVYVQVDVKVTDAVPTYRIKLLTGTAAPTTLTTDSYYIITTLGTGVNWSSIDSTYYQGKVYELYTIIQYNGAAITGSGYTLDITFLQQTVGYSNAQTAMTINQTISDLILAFTFMMGSINALGGIVTQVANSNICFPAGTPVKTDQGIVPIERIDINRHSINGQDIQHITQTVTLDKYLICFPKDSLYLNYPNKTTVMTKDHKIEYNGQMVPAFRFLDFSAQVKKVKYSGEVLYNVLLDNYSTMTVNNLVCETLHPDNVIAKLHMSTFSEEYKQNVISIMNDALQRKDEVAYKSIVNRL